MSMMMNYDPPRERKPITKEIDNREHIKNQECVSCKKLFECDGKPRANNGKCLFREERGTT